MERLVIRNLSPEIIKKAIETYKSGLSFEQTSQIVGLPAHTVRRIIVITPRSTGAPVSFNSEAELRGFVKTYK